GLDFELLVWPTAEAVKRPAAMHAAYTWAIADALDEAGIEVPFPQTDLRLRSLFGREGDDALAVMGMGDRAAARTRPAPRRRKPAAPAVNDAVGDLLKPRAAEAADDETERKPDR